MLLEGSGVTKDVPKGVDALKRACDGGQAGACVDLGMLSENGKDAPKNPILAKLLYQRGCFRGNAQACFAQGRMELGFGGTPEMAKRAFEMACFRNDNLSCAAMKVLFGGTRMVVPGPEAMELTNRCNGGSVRDCGIAGLLNTATGNPMAKSQNRASVHAAGPLACAVKNKK